FLAMGLGLAAPYLLGATVPRLVSLLPRPGRWMLGLRFAFGQLLLGTALWLLSVLVRAGGGAQALLVGGAAAALLAVLAARRYAGLARALVGGLAGALVVAAVAVAAVLPRAPEAAARQLPAGPWRRFDQASISAEVAQGRIVFVDVTAAWCLVCKVNELTVLDRDPVATRLRASGVVAMRADWTRPSPAITAYLQSFGRYGVPLDVVYGPGAPQGVKLPDLLTADAVMRAFAEAAGPPRVAAGGTSE
ncbi:MAG: thioredoxin family protein, partial [Rhodospirillales bacterium]|nr:thioredoxin family protein [Rhodospirillales bacterium]